MPPQSATVVTAMRENVTSPKKNRTAGKRQPRFSSFSYASYASSTSSAPPPTSAPLSASRITSHKSRVTPSLIATAAIRNRRNSFKIHDAHPF